MDQQGNEHGSAALVLPAVVHGPASPKRRKMVVGKGWKMMKVDKGGVRSSRKTVDPAENIKDAVKALEAKTEALANRLAQVEVHSQIASAAIDLLVGSVDNRFAVLAGELNQYAAQVEQGKAAVEASLQAHLARIDGTFQQCDAILGTMHGLVTSAPAVVPPAVTPPQFFTQDLVNIRRSIDEGDKMTTELKNNFEKLEDRHIHEAIATTAEQAWSR